MRLMRPHACQVGKTYLLDRDGLAPSSLGSSMEAWGRVNRTVGPSLSRTAAQLRRSAHQGAPVTSCTRAKKFSRPFIGSEK